MATSAARNQKYHTTDAGYFRSAQNALQHALEKNQINDQDAALIKKFTNRLKSEISAGRYAKITGLLITVRKFCPCQFSELDEDGLFEVLGAIRYAVKTEGKHQGEPYTDNAKTDFLKILKRFYQFLAENGLTTIPEKVINQIKPGRYSMLTKSDADVLEPEEIQKLLDVVKNPKYKCYFSLLYETGARSIELANLKWGDIEFREWGAVVALTDFKANVPQKRHVPVIAYRQFLAEWQARYTAGEPTADKYVFVSPDTGEPIQYRAVTKALNRYAKAAGITKKASLHRIRHTRITHALQQGMTETIAKRAFWGNLSTNMIKTYAHLTDKDVEDSFLEMAGVERPDEAETQKKLEPVQCPICHTVNPPGSNFCSVCGQALNEKSAKNAAEAETGITEILGKMSDAEKFKFLQLIQLQGNNK